jgi:hypothetical protein
MLGLTHLNQMVGIATQPVMALMMNLMTGQDLPHFLRISTLVRVDMALLIGVPDPAVAATHGSLPLPTSAWLLDHSFPESQPVCHYSMVSKNSG